MQTATSESSREQTSTSSLNQSPCVDSDVDGSDQSCRSRLKDYRDMLLREVQGMQGHRLCDFSFLLIKTLMNEDEEGEEIRFCFGLCLLLLISKLSHSSIITEVPSSEGSNKEVVFKTLSNTH